MLKGILKDIKGVIFDLDGTLVDSMWIWKQIDIEYLGARNIEMPEDLQSKIEGMSFYETAVYFKETYKIPDSLEVIMDNWNDMAMEKYRSVVPLKECVKEFLQLLRNKGIVMGIATSNSRILTEAALDNLGISEYFGAIVTGSEIIKGKPEPDVYLTAAGKLLVDPKTCLVFEDLPFGIMAGKRAGMKTCAIDDVYSATMWDEKVALADYSIKSYKEILEAVAVDED